jgi:hypothetical protein
MKKPAPDNRLLFCISSGRSGSGYLAKLLNTSIEVVGFHEPEPFMNGKYLQMVNTSTFSQTFKKRRIKCKFIEKELDNLSQNKVYCETSHMFIKTFFDVVLDRFNNVEVIILRRDIAKILKSFIELGYFSEINSAWPDWMSSPNSKTAALQCIDSDQMLDQYDLCIAYLIDIEARTVRFQNDFPDVQTHAVTLESLNEYNMVEALFRDLRITPTEETKRLTGKMVNVREEGKKHFDNPSDLDYCRQRIDLYTEKALDKNIKIPELFYRKE